MNTASAAATEIDLAAGARQMPRRRVLLPRAVELSSFEERQRRALGRRAWMEFECKEMRSRIADEVGRRQPACEPSIEPRW
jgi:hypothetical protein